MYARTGYPLEYWHGTGGYATTSIVKQWLTRIRSCVHTYDPKLWIVLVLDCSTCHVNANMAMHARHLGIILVLVPASLTWLLQITDVYVYSRLKTRMRQGLLRRRLGSAHGLLDVGS